MIAWVAASWAATQATHMALAQVAIAGVLVLSLLQEGAPPRFPTSAQLVQLTVRVTDKEGHGVTGLQLQDFTVRDNKAPRPLTFFQTLAVVGVIEDGARDSTAAVPSPAHVGPSQYVVIAFEPMGFEARSRAIGATRTFLQRLASRPGYQVALIDGPKVFSAATDPKAALDVLDRQVARRGNPGRLDGASGAWIATLAQVLDRLAAIPGRKALVRFVDYDVGIFRDFLVPLANRANVAVYPVDARGVSVVVPFGDASTEAGRSEWSGMSPTSGAPAIAADVNNRSSALLAQTMQLRSVARSTGGIALTGENRLGQIFDKMIESNRGVYVIGYSLTPDLADGRWHRVDVKVADADLVVHVKDGYFAPGSAPSP